MAAVDGEEAAAATQSEEKRSANAPAEAAASPRDLEVGHDIEESDIEKLGTSSASASASEDPSFASSSEAILKDSKPRKSGRRRKITCTACCCIATLAAIGIAVGVLWPKDPSWQVEKLSFHKEDLSTVIAAMTDPNYDSIATFNVNCTVKFFNSNYIGAQAGEGHFKVSLGDLQLATSKTLPQKVPAHGSSVIETRTEVVLSPTISQVMMPLVTANDFKFSVNVEGSLPVKAIFGIKLSVGVKCAVHLKALLMISDPDHMVSGHDCEYSY